MTERPDGPPHGRRPHRVSVGYQRGQPVKEQVGRTLAVRPGPRAVRGPRDLTQSYRARETPDVHRRGHRVQVCLPGLPRVDRLQAPGRFEQERGCGRQPAARLGAPGRPFELGGDAFIRPGRRLSPVPGSCALVGAASVTFLTTGNATIQLASEPRYRGRVTALWSTALVGSTPIGAPVVGALSDVAGPDTRSPWAPRHVSPAWPSAAAPAKSQTAQISHQANLPNSQVQRTVGAKWGAISDRYEATKSRLESSISWIYQSSSNNQPHRPTASFSFASRQSVTGTRHGTSHLVYPAC